MDASDAYWGAKIVAAFTDELIVALASAGQYSRPEVAADVERTFRERRDRIGRYWFEVVSPLEGFELAGGEGRSRQLRFRDLGVERGYARERRYRFETRDATKLERIAQGETAGEISLEIDPSPPALPPDRFGRSPRLVVDVFASPEALPVRVVIGTDSEGGPKVLGWKHAPR